MATQIAGSTITNKVVFKTDTASLKKVMEDIRRVQKVSSAMSMGIAASPRLAQQQIRQVRAQVAEIADAHVRAFKDVSKEKAQQMAKNSQDFYANLFGYNSVSKSARGSAAVFEASMSDWREKVKRQNAMMSEAYREDKKRDRASDALRRAQEREQRRRASRLDTTQAKESFFAYEGSKTRASGTPEFMTAQHEVNRLSQAYVEGRISLRQYNEATRQLLAGVRTEAKEMLTLRETLHSIRGEWLLLTAGAGYAIKSVIDTGKKFQEIGLSYQTAFGPEAAHQMQFVREEANRLGLNMLDLSKEYTSFAYSAKMMGMSQADVENGFKAMTEGATAFGLSSDKTRHVMLAFREMVGEGRIQSRQLIYMLGNQLPGAVEIFAKAFDPKTFAKNPQEAMKEIRAAMKAGTVDANALLPKVFKLMREAYAPVIAKGMHNVAHEQERFNNSLNDFKYIMFSGGVGNLASSFFGVMGEGLVALKPMAALIGGIADAFSNMIYYVRLAIAYIKDFFVQMGWLDYQTNRWKESILGSWHDVGEAIGTILELFIGKKALGWLSFLAKSRTSLAGASGEAKGLLGTIRAIAAFGGKVIAIDVAMHLLSFLDKKQKELKTQHDKNGRQYTLWEILTQGGVTHIPGLLREWQKNNADPQSNILNPTGWQGNGASFNPYARSPMQQPKQPEIPVHVTVTVNDGTVKDLIQAKVDELTSDMSAITLSK